MEFSINRTILNNAVSNVLKAVSTKTLIPILTGIKIEVFDDQIILSGSDTNISITQKIQDPSLKIRQTGEIVITGQLLSNIVRKLPNQDVDIITNNLQVKIESGKAVFDIKGQTADAFPTLPKIDDDQPINLESKKMSFLINQTIKAVSKVEVRPILTGIHFVLNDGILKAIATDSHRLAQTSININSDDDFELTVTAKAMNDLKSFLDSYQEFSMTRSNSQLKFDFGEVTFYCQLLEGEYPKTDGLIPDSFNSTIKTSTKDFIETIDRADIISKESRNVVIKLEIKNSTVDISSSSQEVGEINEPLENIQVTGEDLLINFNPVFIRDAITALNTDRIVLEFNESLKPFVIKAEDSDNQDQLQLITPVRTF